MLSKRIIITSLFFGFCLFTFLPWQSICHASLTLEGQFIRNGEKLAEEQQVKMTVRIYDDEFGGEALFAENQNVTAGPKKSVFIFEHGKVTTHQRTSDLEPENLWVEVESDGQVLSPRLKLSYIDTVNNLEGNSISLRNASLRSSGTATLLIDDNGVTLGDLLNLTLGGVARNSWPTGGGGSSDADTLDGHDSTYFMPAATDNWVNTTGDTMTGPLTVNGDLYANASISVGTDNGTDNDAIYFDGETLQHLMWDNSRDKFLISNDLSLQGTLQAGTNSLDTPTTYNRFGVGTASHTVQVTNPSDLLVSEDLEVNGRVYADDNLWVGTDDTTDNDFIYFDAGYESIQWNNQTADFRLSDDLQVDGDLQVNGDYLYRYAKTYDYQIAAIEFREEDTYDNHYIVTSAGGRAHWYDFEVWAPVHLPKGAVITALTLYFIDNDSLVGFDYINALLFFRSPNSTATTTVASIAAETTAPFASSNILQISDNTISNALVTDSKQYILRVMSHIPKKSVALKLHGCKITYTIDKVAP